MIKKIKVQKNQDRKYWIKQDVGQTNFAQKRFGQKKLRAIKKLGTKSLVKIGAVISEVFLVWAKVAKANVVWTNVTVTVFPGSYL